MDTISLSAYPGLDMAVIGLCADYGRRKRALERGGLGFRVEMEYRYYNNKILDAATEIAGERDGEVFIHDIGYRVGYAASELYYLSEAAYKTKKQEVKVGIARKLHLME